VQVPKLLAKYWAKPVRIQKDFPERNFLVLPNSLGPGNQTNQEDPMIE